MATKEEYQSRRMELVEKMNDGVLILPSYTYQKYGHDTEYDFRQHPDFLYYTGFPEPDSIALIEKDGTEIKYTLFVPQRDEEFETWVGKRYGPEGAISKFGAQEAYTNTEFESKLNEIIPKYEHVYFPLGENESIDNIVITSIKKGIKSRDKVGDGPTHLINPLPITHLQRSLKTNVELELMKKTTRISAEAMKLAIQVSKPGMKESQIQSVIEYHYQKNGARRPAYSTIAGSGVNATILHYTENSETLQDGDLLLVDAGAEYNGYAADITRTWPINGTFSKEQAEIYQLVLDTQLALIEQVKPGASLQELQDMSHRLLAAGLIKLGILEGELEKVMEEQTYQQFTLHGVGHWLGLDVHDTYLIKKDFKFQPSQIFTVEPGIYLPDKEEVPESYRGIGVRIEDDILVTEDGSIDLSAGVPKTIKEIESLVGTSELP